MIKPVSPDVDDASKGSSPPPRSSGAASHIDATSPAARRAPWYVAGAVALAWGVDFAIDPTSTHIPLCPFHSATGLWCPLCGGLRAAYELGHGRLAVAVRDNVLFVGALPVLALYFADWLLRSRRGVDRRGVPRPMFVAVLILAAVFWIVRNLPGFEALRPL